MLRLKLSNDMERSATISSDCELLWVGVYNIIAVFDLGVANWSYM
jgi:hypothetical protein